MGVRGLAITAAVALACVAGCATQPQKSSAAALAPANVPDVAELGRLRAEYGGRKDFDELCYSRNTIEQISLLSDAGQWNEVLALSQPWVERCPVDIAARLVTAAALKKLGREAEAQEQLAWYRGLIDSILVSGDGKTPATAYVVISIREEYSVLYDLGLRPTEQALLDGGIDAVKAESKSGTSTVYFNPAASFRRLRTDLGE